jgi:ribulose-5-phosphate 4-epimerase/fuculose-1-phosphate aldolase
MADGSQVSLKGQVSEAEWAARVDLAALYRLAALFGWDDTIFTHISARIPGPEHHFLINPWGWFFDEMTASCLVKVDLEGTVVSQTDQFINPAGFTIHSAVHGARPDAHFVIHLHADGGVAVSAQKEGLLPLTQHAALVAPHVAYHDYEGVALHLDERARLIADLGDKKLMILRNHGALAVGATAGEAWNWMYYLEKACRQQVMALSAGRAGVQLPSDAAQAETSQTSASMPFVAGLAWPGFLRLLDRKSPGYAA